MTTSSRLDLLSILFYTELAGVLIVCPVCCCSFRLFDEQKDVLILLFLEEIPAQLLSPYHRMRKMLKRRTYLSWPQAGRHAGVFWQNIQRALETEDFLTDNTDLLPGPAGH